MKNIFCYGKVKRNGEVVKDLGIKIDPNKDEIEFENKRIKQTSNGKIYILLNKPIGYVTTSKDQFNRDTVLDLTKEIKERIVPCGRLDMYTSGALILSNDGEFINIITHPSNEIEKTYNVTLKGIVTQEQAKKLENGIRIEDYITSKAKVKILKIDQTKDISRVQITIHEGKNRQIRKMCEAIEKKVLGLHRAKVGDLDVKNLEIGKWRYLTKEEVNKLIKK